MFYPLVEYSLIIYLVLDFAMIWLSYKRGLVSKTLWVIAKIFFPIELILSSWFRKSCNMHITSLSIRLKVLIFITNHLLPNNLPKCWSFRRLRFVFVGTCTLQLGHLRRLSLIQLQMKTLQDPVRYVYQKALTTVLLDENGKLKLWLKSFDGLYSVIEIVYGNDNCGVIDGRHGVCMV